MSKVRINDLARELEVKSRPILDALEAIGVTGKTHSSSIEADQAERVRAYFSGNRGSVAKPAADTRPKFDLSKVSKPGDALKAILERKQAEAIARSAPPPRPAVAAVPPPSAVAVAPPARPVVPAKPAASVVAAATPTPASEPAVTPAQPPRRIIMPQPRQHANIVAPPQAAPAIASKPPVGPVIARPPVVPTPPVPAPATVPVPPVAVKPAPVTPAAEASAPVAPIQASEEPVAATPDVQPEQAALAAPVPPVRRVIMPQTGPRPIYTAPPAAPGVPPTGPPYL